MPSSNSQPLYDDSPRPYRFGLSRHTLQLALHTHEPISKLDNYSEAQWAQYRVERRLFHQRPSVEGGGQQQRGRYLGNRDDQITKFVCKLRPGIKEFTQKDEALDYATSAFGRSLAIRKRTGNIKVLVL